MKKLIGDRRSFAIEIEIIQFKPLWGKSCLWINNCQIGHLDDENYLAPFLGSAYRIAKRHKDFWLEELAGLKCKDAFYAIHPFYNEPHKFDELSSDEAKPFFKYDIFIIQWGENFDDWIVDVIVDNNLCQFMWVYTPLRDNDSFEAKNNIQCHSVKLEDIQRCYDELVTLVPDEHWPGLIPK